MKTYFFGIGATFLLTFLLPIAMQAQGKPNIVYIYADDLGYGDLGCYGQKKIQTPFIDRMSLEGIRFTQHYASAPVCAPSRCMLLTGKHAGHAYIRGNYEMDEKATEEVGQMPLSPDVLTVARYLQNTGYATAMIGKWGLGMPHSGGEPTAAGFGYYFGYLDQKQAHNYYPTHLWENGVIRPLNNPVIPVHTPLIALPESQQKFETYIGNEYAPDLLTEKAIAFIQQNKERPFFLYLPYNLPHVSLQVPEQFSLQYRNRFQPFEKPYWGDIGYTACQYPLSTYAGMITYLDQQVGLILQTLAKNGIDSNTIVFFSSDNGATHSAGGANASFFQSNGQLRGYKSDVYEGGIRVPLIVRWPGKIAAATVTDHLSVQYDFFATVTDLVQGTPVISDGISFLPTLLGAATPQPQHVFLYFEYADNGGQIAIRQKKWKAIKTDLRWKKNAVWQLYDLENDISEQKDVAFMYPEVVQKMEQLLMQHRKSAHIREWNFF